MEVFYYPHDAPLSSGPTELVPRTHLSRYEGPRDSHPDGVVCADPAGSFVIHHQSILHRRSAVPPEAPPRYMLKFIYYRTEPPTPAASPFRAGAAELAAPGIVGGALERGGFSNAAAKILCWMDGREHADIGGQGWPNWQPNQIVAS